MKILKQLSKIIFKITLILFFYNYSFANEPIDIWKIEKKDIINKENSTSNINASNNLNTNTTLSVQSSSEIVINKEIESSTIKLAGLYDPAQNGLKIDMWSNSDGELIKSILNKNLKRNLSQFSKKILDIALLTNSYIPTNNITEEEFLEFKFNHLINKKDFELIKEFLINNSEVSNKNKLINENSDSDHPSQIYAASKRSTEIIAHSYSDLYNLPIICLRFFTLYGPWGRPDMSLNHFVKNIISNKKISLFNRGDHIRDFTYIDDIVKGISLLINKTFAIF